MNSKEIIISTDKALLDMDIITGFLARSYWAGNRPVEKIRKSIENSICYGAYHGVKQVGFARIVTDGATVFYLCDVFVDEDYRGYGIGKKLIAAITSDEEFKNYFGILGTKDAHGLYEQFDFEKNPTSYMTRKADSIRAPKES